jgi:hypothetical protein
MLGARNAQILGVETNWRVESVWRVTFIDGPGAPYSADLL